MCNKALWPVETRAVCIIVYIVKFWVPNVRNGSSVMAKDAGGGVLNEIVCGTVLWIHGRVCVCSGSLLKACACTSAVPSPRRMCKLHGL